MTRREQIRDACDKILAASHPLMNMAGMLYAAAEWADANNQHIEYAQKQIGLRTIAEYKLAIAVEALKQYADLINFKVAPYMPIDTDNAEMATAILKHCFEPYCMVAHEALAKIQEIK